MICTHGNTYEYLCVSINDETDVHIKQKNVAVVVAKYSTHVNSRRGDAYSYVDIRTYTKLYMLVPFME